MKKFLLSLAIMPLFLFLACPVILNTPVPVASIALDKSDLSLGAGSTATLVASVSPDNAANKAVTWGSSNPAVASVAGGVVSGISAGTSIVTASSADGGKTASCTVTVLAANVAVTAIALNKTTLNVNVGESDSLSPVFTPLNASNQGLSWSSDAPAVATVVSGVVTGVAAGSAVITATSTDGAKTATCAVTVVAVPVASVGLSKTVSYLTVGGTEPLTAAVQPANAANKAVTWSSGNASIATVSASGVVTGVATGDTSITVTTVDQLKTATCTIHVVASIKNLTAISLPVSASVVAASTITLTPAYTPADATNQTVTWSSDNTSIATVAGGVVTGVSAGVANIKATSNDGGFIAICAVTVTVPVTGVSISKTSSSLAATATEQLTATVLPAGASNKNVTWSTGNAAIATVNATGLVTGQAVGTTSITVTTVNGSFTAICAYTITPAIVPVTGIALNKATSSIQIGATDTLTVSFSPASATNQGITWSTDNASVATVIGGVVTAVAVGTAHIKATASDGGFNASCTVTVSPIPVSSVSLDKTTSALLVNGTDQLTATILPGTATNTAVTWSSSNTNVATVNATGLITAKTIGTATITVTTTDGSKTATCAVTVKDLVINEVVNSNYINYAIAVEIYNPTSQTIDLGQYSLRAHSVYNDGAASTPTYASGGIRNFALPSLSVPAGGYIALRGKAGANFESGGNTVYVDDAGLPYAYMPAFAYSNDFVELAKAGSTVDFVRWGTSTWVPASSGFVFNSYPVTFPTGAAYIGYALARDSSSTNTKSASDWTLRAWSTLGGVNDVTGDADADGDGIPDSAEASSSSTFAGLPLYNWGARTGQKDIFINIDYMDSADAGITPQKAALDKVVAAFNVQGIKIHFDVGDLFSASVDPANYNLDGRSHKVAYNQSIALGKGTGFANVYKYKVDSMPVAKSKLFFYMLFANSQKADGSAGSSGIANLPGNTSIITLGQGSLTASGTTEQLNKLVNYQAATMMHEFGHNLGLHHGGNDDDNYKPNYFSVMNYMYQLYGLPSLANADTRYYLAYGICMGVYSVSNPTGLNPAWIAKANTSAWADGPSTSSFLFTYSNGSSPSLSESNLSEVSGVGPSGSAAVDLNMDGDVLDTSLSLPLRYLLDPSATNSTTRSVLADFNDWGAISSVFQRGYMGTFAGASLITSQTPAKNAVATDMVTIFNNPNPTNSTPCAPQVFSFPMKAKR